MLPKVKFEFVKLNREVRILSDDCVPLKTGWNYSDFVYYNHPYLRRKLVKVKTRAMKLKTIRDYTKNFWFSEFEQLKTQKTLFQREWDKVNDGYMKTLSEILETSYPTDRKRIIAFISINPICPRFLKQWAFQGFYMQRLSQMRETVAHEVLHLLYFKKWKEVFPTADERTFGIPHLEWHLSEILAPIVLGDKRIQDIIKSEVHGFEEHAKIRFGKRNLMEHFEKLYKKSVKKKEPFAQFLQTAYKEAQKHKDKILNA